MCTVFFCLRLSLAKFLSLALSSHLVKLASHNTLTLQIQGCGQALGCVQAPGCVQTPGCGQAPGCVQTPRCGQTPGCGQAL